MKETTPTQHNMDKLTRRNIRYICFRLQTEATGGTKAEKEDEGIMQFVDEVRGHMEEQEDFDGWNNFGKTWDVGEKSFLVAVLRKSSIQSEWDKVLKDEAKPLPGTEDKVKETQPKKKQSKKSFWDKLQ